MTSSSDGTRIGPAPPPIPQPAPTLTDSTGGVWSIIGGWACLNGVSVNGHATLILLLTVAHGQYPPGIYVQSPTGGYWWQWLGNGLWKKYTTDDPSVGLSVKASIALVESPDTTNMAGTVTAALPPPPQGGKDAIAIYDGPANLAAGSPPGGVSKHFLYQSWLPWKNVGGDWIDAAGVAQGTTPFSQVSVTTGAVGSASADVTTLVKQSTSMMLRGVGSATVVCNGRETGSGPTLVYDTPSGPVTANCTADAECNPSTDYEIGAQTTWTVSSANSVYLSFPAPPTGWTKAVLVLPLNKVWTGGKINVYQFAWGGLPPMANPTETLSLKGDPRVFFETADFTDIPPYLKAQIFGDPVHSMNLDTYQQRNLVKDENGKTVLQVSFDPRVNAALVASILFPNGDEADEAAVEFEMRFMPDMLTGLTQGFKCFAGFRSATKPDDAYFAKIWGTQVGRAGTLLAGNGGSKSHGYDGWSTRFDMFKSPGPTHPLYGHFAPMQYVYWPEQFDYFGDPRLWNGAGFTPLVGEWHRYTTHLKCNSCVGTVFQKDASLAMWLDGILAHRWDGFYLRTTDHPLIMDAPYNVMDGVTYNVKSQLRIGSVWLNTYHGGLLFPSARCSFQVRNLRVAKFA